MGLHGGNGRREVPRGALAGSGPSGAPSEPGTPASGVVPRQATLRASERSERLPVVLEGEPSRQPVEGKPLEPRRVIGRANGRVPAPQPGRVVDVERRVPLYPVGVRKSPDKAFDAHIHAELLTGFPPRRRLCGFSALDESARDIPGASCRRNGPTNEQHAASSKDHHRGGGRRVEPVGPSASPAPGYDLAPFTNSPQTVATADAVAPRHGSPPLRRAKRHRYGSHRPRPGRGPRTVSPKYTVRLGANPGGGR